MDQLHSGRIMVSEANGGELPVMSLWPDFRGTPVDLVTDQPIDGYDKIASQ